MKNIEMVKPIPIESIDLSKHKISVRFETEAPESEELEQLTNSIKQSGVIEPIIIRPKGASRYEVVAGNRRLRAGRVAKLDTMPAIVRDLTDEQAIRIAYAENVHRKNLNPIQKAKGIAAIYKLINVEKDDAIQRVKYLWNLASNSSKSQTLNKSIRRESAEANITDEFMHAFKEIALSGNTQYQFLQLIVQLPQETQNKIEETGLTRQKATLLTHSRLREEPEVQQYLAEKIKDKSLKQAEPFVRQAIHDLETGYLSKDDVTDGLSFGLGGREYVKDMPELDQTFDATWPDLVHLMRNTIGKLLHRQLTKGEIEYTPAVYNPKIEELKKNMQKLKHRERTIMAIEAGILMLVCKAIVDSAK
jgi:ParB family transcriptional regulator, chromosome partitioning protein